MAQGDHLQSRSADSGTGTSVALAYLSNVTSGSFLSAWVRSGGLVSIPTVSSTRVTGNWTRVILQDISGDSQLSFHWAIAESAGACTVTLATASVTRRWGIQEHDSAGATPSIDKSASTEGSSTAANSGNTAATTVASELLLGGVITSNDNSVAPGGGFTERQEQPASPASRIEFADLKVSSTGTYAYSATINSDAWACAIATVKWAAGGGATSWLLVKN